MECPHLTNTVCEIATEVAGTPCNTTEENCLACIKCLRPKRLNLHTTTLAFSQNPKLDMKHIQSIIDEEHIGFGTKLSRLFGLILIETPDCGCKGHKDVLDVWTEDHVRKNMEKVIDWLQKEARTRRLPFSRALTRILLNRLLPAPSSSQSISER